MDDMAMMEPHDRRDLFTQAGTNDVIAFDGVERIAF